MDAANTLVLVTAFLLTGLFIYDNFVNPIDLSKAEGNLRLKDTFEPVESTTKLVNLQVLTQSSQKSQNSSKTKSVKTPSIKLQDHVSQSNTQKRTPGTYSFTHQTTKFLSNCEKYISPKRHASVVTSNFTVKDFAKAFHRTNDIRVDYVKKHIYCFEPKAGTTNWSRLSTAVAKNITFNELIKKYPHNFVYDYLPSTKAIYNHAGSKYG